jgi:hypothetical protein
MRRVAPVLVVLLAASSASAQLVPLGFVSRAGSPRGATTLAARINRVDCAAGEVITVTASLPAPTAGVPELWVSETTACDPTVREPALGATCFAICSATASERRACTIPYAQGEREYTFTVPVRWLVDPRSGLCAAVTGRRYLQVVVGDTVVARSSPSIRVDLVAPQAPLSVVASLGAVEESASLTWSYPVVDAGTVEVDAGDVDAGDAGDAGADVVDASADVVDVVDVPVDTGAGPSADPEVETLAGFYVLCSPPAGSVPTPGLDGGACPTVPFAGLDVNDDATLRRWACLRDPLEGTARGVVVDGLTPAVAHRFGVVAEDLAGNRSAVTYSGDCVSPRAVNDFWEEYRRQGGQAQPGACAVATPGARASGASLVMLLGAAWALRRRRARRRPERIHRRALPSSRRGTSGTRRPSAARTRAR